MSCGQCGALDWGMGGKSRCFMGGMGIGVSASEMGGMSMNVCDAAL